MDFFISEIFGNIFLNFSKDLIFEIFNGFFVFNTVSAVSAFAKTSATSFGDLLPKYFDTYLAPLCLFDYQLREG